MNRLQLLLGIYGFGFINMAATMVVIALVLPKSTEGGFQATQFWTLYYVAQAPWIISAISLLVRRAHDLGLSGFVVLFLPAHLFVLTAISAIWPSFEESLAEILFVLVGVSAAFAFILRAGQVGFNRFGPTPQRGWLPF